VTYLDFSKSVDAFITLSTELQFEPVKIKFKFSEWTQKIIEH